MPRVTPLRGLTMAVRFVLGRAGAGKTHHCLAAVRAALAQAGQVRRLVLLVPEQASFQMERALAQMCPTGGYTRAAVLSFSRLAVQELEAGGAPPTLRPGLRRAALWGILAAEQPKLKLLAGAARTPGFATRLERLVDELLREDVAPGDLRAAAARLEHGAGRRKVAELAQLYDAYVAWLGTERIDPAARLAALRARLDGVAWLPEASLWVDGFAGFTGQEQETLVALAERARDVTITLLVDPESPAIRDPERMPDELGLFQRTEQTYQQLRRRFAATGVKIAEDVALRPGPVPRLVRAPRLQSLEAGLATPLGVTVESAVGGDAKAVRVVTAGTHREELAAAARWIRTQIIDSGGRLHYRDFAVIARDLEPFADLVQEVFEAHDVPYFLDRRRSIKGHPLARLVGALLAAVTGDFRPADVVALLRTRLLPLSRDAAERLENLVVRHGVWGRATWTAGRWAFEGGVQEDEDLVGARRRLMAAAGPLCALADEEGASAARWAAALDETLEALGVRATLGTWIDAARRGQQWEAAELHRLAWEAVCALLEDLRDALGSQRLRGAEFATLADGVLAEVTVGLAPPTLDQVLISSIERSRHPEVKHAWVFALNEGVFPAHPTDEPLLAAVERDELIAAGAAVQSARRADVLAERLLAYIALTRPSDGVVVSYAQVGLDGGALVPSPLLSEVQRALPDLVVETLADDGPPTTVLEVAEGYLRARRADADAVRRRRAAALVERVEALPARGGELRWRLRGLAYRNTPAPLGNYRTARADGVVWDGSPSEVETALQCPFRHFARYGLRLDAERGPQPVRWDLGSIAHGLLAIVTERAQQEPGGVRAVSDARWAALLEAAVAEYWSGLPDDIATRRPELVSLGGVLSTLLGELVQAHAERYRRGAFEPLLCERAFDARGEEGALPPLELTLPDAERFRVHGKIDRVDVCDDEGERWLLVYDYKSGGGAIRGEYLTGAKLQLMLYLMATLQAFGDDWAVRPAGVLLAPLYPDLRALDTQRGRAAVDEEQRMLLVRPRGAVAREAVRLLDPGLFDCGSAPSPVVQVRAKKDGGFYSNSDAVPAVTLDAYIELAQRTVTQAVGAICEGRIEPAPLVERRTLACTTCPFGAVCRFERALNAVRPVETSLPALAEILDAGEA
jgi:ATP-dependent helicase/nuclease subunit B